MQKWKVERNGIPSRQYRNEMERRHGICVAGKGCLEMSCVTIRMKRKHRMAMGEWGTGP